MNTAVASTKSFYRQEISVKNSLAARTGTVWKILFPCFLVLATGLAFIWLQSNTEEMRNYNSDLREKNITRERQISNLRIEWETATSRREILKRVTEYNLGLGPPMVGQTRRLAMDQPANQPPAENREWPFYVYREP